MRAETAADGGNRVTHLTSQLGAAARRSHAVAPLFWFACKRPEKAGKKPRMWRVFVVRAALFSGARKKPMLY
jgi:hypothetical protein